MRLADVEGTKVEGRRNLRVDTVGRDQDTFASVIVNNNPKILTEFMSRILHSFNKALIK